MAAIQPPDAFLCNDNLTAFGVLKALKSLNLDVPGRVGLVAFDNYPLAEYTDPPLTAVNVDTALLGEQTARLLFQRIKRPSGNQQIMLSTALIERESSHRM
jgi:DNA-binding LacI/PurR family transcriptional regulator